MKPTGQISHCIPQLQPLAQPKKKLKAVTNDTFDLLSAYRGDPGQSSI